MRNTTRIRLSLCASLCLLSAWRAPAAPAAPAPDPAPRFDWMPPEAAGGTADSLAGTPVPEIGITETPKPTADLSRYTNAVTLDLEAFGIRSGGADPEATSRGINAALQHARTSGFNRIVFPKGVYRISATNPVVIDHRNTVIDLNGATLQIQPNGLPKYAVVTFVDGADTVRLCNGFLAGDRDAHDYKTEPGTHEWGSGLLFNGGRNLEADHLVISNMTGDGVVSHAYGTRTRAELLATILDSVDIRNLEPGAFTDRGERTASAGKTRTIKPYDLARSGGAFEFGYTMGYQGYPYVKGRAYQSLFYDAATNFIEKRTCLQFRRVPVPGGARFLHLEFNQPEVTGDVRVCGRITAFRPSTDVHLHDNTLIRNRRLGMAYCGGQRWLIENNRFEENGGTPPAFGVDFEDGWELMQDVVMRGNTFRGNRAGDLVVCAGSELLFESNRFEKAVVVWGRPHNYTFRGNRFTGGSVGYRTRTGVASIHDNVYEDCVLSIVFDTKAVADGLYREPGRTVATPPLVLRNETLRRVKEVSGTYFCFEDSRLESVRLKAGPDTRLVRLTRCELADTSLVTNAPRPDLSIKVESCTGALTDH